MTTIAGFGQWWDDMAMSTRQATIATDPQAAQQRIDDLAKEATALDLVGSPERAAAVWERHRWARNAIRRPEDALAEGLDLIATAQALTVAARSARSNERR